MARQQPGGGLRETRTPVSVVEPTTLPPPVLDLTVVVPYYNPGPALRATVHSDYGQLRDELASELKGRYGE